MSVLNKAKALPREREQERAPGLWRHIVGIISVLTTTKDPYDLPLPPSAVLEQWTDANGYTAYRVSGTARDVSRYTDGVSVEGKRVVHERVGRNEWIVRVE